MLGECRNREGGVGKWSHSWDGKGGMGWETRFWGGRRWPGFKAPVVKVGYWISEGRGGGLASERS